MSQIKSGEALPTIVFSNANEIKDQSLGGKERASLLKLVLGLVLTNYEYNPQASRNATSKEISDDLLLHGIRLDEDTVRKWLNASKEFLPENWEQPQ